MPSIMVRGVGHIPVTRMPKRIPSTITTISGHVHKIKQQDFLEAWALTHRVGHRFNRARFRQILSERVIIPTKKHKVSAIEAFKDEVEMSLGSSLDVSDVEYYYDRGNTVEQTVSALRPHIEPKKKEKEDE